MSPKSNDFHIPKKRSQASERLMGEVMRANERDASNHYKRGGARVRQKDWDTQGLTKRMLAIEDQRRVNRDAVKSEYDFQKGTRTYYRRDSDGSVNGKRTRSWKSYASVNDEMDKKVARDRIRHYSRKVDEMQKRRLAVSKISKQKNFMDSEHMSPEQRARRAKTSSKDKIMGRTGKAWSKEEDRKVGNEHKKIRVTVSNRILLSNDELGKNYAVQRNMKESELLSEGAGKAYLEAAFGSRHKTRSMLSIVPGDPNNHLAKLLGSALKGKKLTPMEIVMFNDAARPPTWKEIKAGNREGVMYSRFVEYGFMRKPTKFWSERHQQVMMASEGWVPGKNYLARLGVKMDEYITKELRPHQDIVLAILASGSPSGQQLMVKLLGVVAQRAQDTLEDMSSSDFGGGSYFAQSWGWFITDKA